MKLDELSIHELIDRALHNSYRKKWNEALRFSEEAIKKAPNNYLAHKRYGLALWYLDKKNEAITALKKSIELEPDFASGYYNLACFYAILTDKKNMLLHLEKAIVLDEYTDFLKMALNDEDFEMYKDDPDFSALVGQHSEEINALQKVFDSGNIEIISEKLLCLGNDIPVEAIDWDDSDVGAKLDELIEEKAHELNYETLLHVFKIIVNHTFIDYFESLYILGTELQKKNPQDFEQVIINEWKNRYTYTDAGHLGQIDHDMLELINDLLPNAKKGELVMWGLTSHGKDALQDYEQLSVSLLEQLPEDHPMRHELVNILDVYLHDNLYIHEDFTTRQQRVRMALPAPLIEVPDDTDDMWGREKIAINHFHPSTVINAATYMAIQRNHPEVVELARQAIPAICGFAIDQTLPVDLRCEAIKVIDKLGDEKEKTTISPVFLEKSYMLLQLAAKALFNCEKIPAESSTAVDTLIQALETEKDHYIIHDVVKAFRWFKDPRVVPGLIGLLNHEKSIVRRETYYGLGIQKANETVEPIVKRLLNDKEQCITAAAHALASIDSEASKKILNDDTVYMYVLQQAKKSPRWAIKALNYFQLTRVNDDLLKLISTTNEIEAYEYLSQGIAQRAIEDSLPKIVAFGLDRYKGRNCIGRFYINMCCSIARAHPDGPDMEMVKQVKEIISEGDKDDISDFTKSLVSDVNYADIGDPTDDEAFAEKNYVEKTKSIFTNDQSEAVALVNGLFGIE